jgi:outer membrane receptor protein involved in Fe transport
MVRYGQASFGLNQPDGSRSDFPNESLLAHAAARVEAKLKQWDLRADVALEHRCFWVPPGEEVSPLLQDVCPQQSARGVAAARTAAESWDASVTGYGVLLGKTTQFFAAPSDATARSSETLAAQRAGLSALWGLSLHPSLRTVAGARFEGEAADVHSSTLGSVTASAATAEPAAAVIYAAGPFRGELAGGISIPLAPASSSWPEGKLTLEWRPLSQLLLSSTAARKGRSPTLRERYDADVGNPLLGPELQTYVDLELRRSGRWLSARAAAFHRWMDGIIQMEPLHQSLVNLAHLKARGVELGLAVNEAGVFGGGIAYGYVSSTTPIENQPTHHGDVYFRLSVPRFGALVRLRYVGERPELGSTLSPYTVTDASAWCQPWPTLRVIARADNVFDQRFQYRRTLLSSGRWLGIGVEVTLD